MITPILRVQDVDRSLAFYTRALGFEGQGGLPGEDGQTVLAEATLGDARILISRRCERLMSACELYITLPDEVDLERFYQTLKRRAVCIVDELHDELWGDRAFTVVDLDANRLIFAQVKRYAALIPERRVLAAGA